MDDLIVKSFKDCVNSCIKSLDKLESDLRWVQARMNMLQKYLDDTAKILAQQSCEQEHQHLIGTETHLQCDKKED